MTTHAGRLPQTTSGPEARTSHRTAKRAVDRRARRGARRAFRPRRVWPALVAAALLTAVGALLAIEVISKLLDRPAGIVPYEGVTEWLTEHSWKAAASIAAAAVLLALGLAALLLGLKPGRTGLVRLRTDDRGLVLGVTPHGLRTAVAEAARQSELVSAVRKVKVGSRKVLVQVETPVQDTKDVRRNVEAAVLRSLDELMPKPRRRVAVRARRS